MNMKVLICCFWVLISANTFAAYASVGEPKKIYGSSWIQFGTEFRPSGVCNYFGRYFRFDATTEKGKNMLSILLAAEMSGRSIEVWYSNSTASGTNHDTGCTLNTMAVVNEIGLGD